jgi:hypothetical protein
MSADLERERLEGRVRESMPAEPPAELLERVRARALAGQAPRRWWKPALGAGVAVAIVALATVGMLTFQANRAQRAFADRAMTVLAPHGKVLHTSIEFREHDTQEGQTPFDQSWAADEWLDVDRKLDRTENRPIGGGALTEMTVSNGVRQHWYAAPSSIASGALIDRKLGSWETAEIGLAGTFGVLRDGIADGKARILSQPTVDGQSCWEVELDGPSDGTSRQRVIALMRKSDFHPLRLTMIEEGVTATHAKTLGTIEIRVLTWEELDRGSLPADFFDLGQVDKVAPEGTPRETRNQ